ncbi:MAG: GNAT family N-acetyltransferase [Sulfolobales archaeon]
MIIRAYRRGDEEGIVELLRTCFDDFNRWGVTVEDWLSYEEGDYGFKKDNALVAEVGGRIVGHLHLVIRRAYIGVGSVDICGIANVSTHPDFRGRGIATALVKRAIEACREMGLPVASLLTGYGGEGYRVYRSVGFSNTAFLRVYVGARDSIEKFLESHEKSELEVEEVDHRNIDEVAKLHDTLRRRVNLVISRPRDYWVGKVLKRFFFYSFFYDRSEEAIKLLFRDSSGPVGYSLAFSGQRASRSYWQKDTGVILEAVATDEKYLKRVISETLRRLLDSGAKVFRLYVPPSYRPILRYGFEEFKGGLLMDYVIDLKKLLSSIRDELSRRAVLAELGGPIGISVKSPYGCANVNVVGSNVEISDSCESENEVEFTRDGIVKIIYGVSSVGKLVNEDQVVRINLSSQAFKAINALFPTRPIYIPRIDQW